MNASETQAPEQNHPMPAEKYKVVVQKVTQEVPNILSEISTMELQVKEKQDNVDRYMYKVLSDANKGILTTQKLEVSRKDIMGECDAFMKLQHKKVKLARDLYDSVGYQVDEIDKAMAVLVEEIEGLQEEAGAQDMKATGGKGGTRGRKGGRGSAAAAQEAVPVLSVTPPIPTIPRHFVEHLFKFPNREPFVEFVDPNEPLYCICKQPSQGEMIGCDNPTCRIEWFHNPCVGIDVAPDQWICPVCKEEADMTETSEKESGRPPNKRSRSSQQSPDTCLPCPINKVSRS